MLKNKMKNFFPLIAAFFLGVPSVAIANSDVVKWNGLVVEPENRCTPYDKRKQYPYPQSVEDEIIKRQGLWSHYTKETFNNKRESDIEHIVAASEAHDSGMCDRSKEEKRAFAKDLDNLTLAHPSLNRYEKSGKDAAEWSPQFNQCWFANQVIKVKKKYNLSVDVDEMWALQEILEDCNSVCSDFDTVYNKHL